MCKEKGVPVCAVDLYSQEQPKKEKKISFLRIALSILVYIECELISLLIEQPYNPRTILALNAIL